MGKLVVVQNDKVAGKDKHNVSGQATNPSAPPPTIAYTGTGEFDYVGKMTDALSDFVKVNGHSLALKNSKSSLNPGESSPPAGKHSGPTGGSFQPTPPVPISTSLSITDTIGEGNPSANSGSTFVKIGGTAVLLDGDKIDTCDGTDRTQNSTVTAENQNFVSCSG